MKSLLSLLAVGLLAVSGCIESSPTSSTPPLSTPDPVVGARDGGAMLASTPEASGIVIRFEQGWAATTYDPETGLRSLWGADLGQRCADGFFTFELVDTQRAFTQSGHNIDLKNDEVHAEVWPLSVWPPGSGFDCSIVLASEPIASGTAHLRRVDNDWDVTGPGANAYGWRLNGTLYGSDGQAFQYRETVVLEILPDGTFELRVVNVQLLPSEGV